MTANAPNIWVGSNTVVPKITLALFCLLAVFIANSGEPIYYSTLDKNPAIEKQRNPHLRVLFLVKM